MSVQSTRTASPPAVTKTGPAAPTAKKIDLARAEAAFDKLVASAEPLADDIPYRQVSAKQVSGWLKSEFGDIKKLSAPHAREAARILEDHAPGVMMGTRMLMFELMNQLETHATQLDAKPKPLATLTGINKGGKVWADIGGKRVPLGTEAVNAWILGGGRYVAWSGKDGSGGYENEGQSLRLYDTQTGKSSKVLTESLMIDKVNSVRLSNGKTALLVKMQDGGLGADHFAVVDPTRGQVFRLPMSRKLSLTGDKVKLGTFPESEWDKPKDKQIPRQTTTLDLKAVLEAPVLVNAPQLP